MELDRLAGCGLFIPTAKGAVALDFVTCFVKCVVLLVRTSNWLFVVVLLDRLLNVLEDIDVDELLFRIKVGYLQQRQNSLQALLYYVFFYFVTNAHGWLARLLGLRLLFNSFKSLGVSWKHNLAFSFRLLLLPSTCSMSKGHQVLADPFFCLWFSPLTSLDVSLSPGLFCFLSLCVNLRLSFSPILLPSLSHSFSLTLSPVWS